MFIFDVRNEQFMPGVHIFLAKNKIVHIFSILIFFLCTLESYFYCHSSKM